MSLPPFRAGRRAFSAWSAFVFVPAALVGTLSLTPVARAQNAKPDDAKPADTKTTPTDSATYTVHRKYKAGDVDRYQINVVINGGLNATLDMLLKESAKETKIMGESVVLSEFEKANAVFNGSEQELTSAMPTFTTRRDKMGKVLESKMEGGNPLITQSPLARMLKNALDLAVYPPKPIKVGDTWKYESDPKQMDQKLKGTATFLGLEMVHGMQTLKIKTVSDIEGNLPNPMTGETISIKQHSEGVQNLDLITGKLVKVKATTSAQDSPGKGELTMDLLPAEGKPGDKKTEDKKPDDKKTEDKKTDEKK